MRKRRLHVHIHTKEKLRGDTERREKTEAHLQQSSCFSRSKATHIIQHACSVGIVEDKIHVNTDIVDTCDQFQLETLPQLLLGKTVLEQVHLEGKELVVGGTGQGGELVQWFLHPSTQRHGHLQQLRVLWKLLLHVQRRIVFKSNITQIVPMYI